MIPIPSSNTELLRFESYFIRDRYLNFFPNPDLLTQHLTEVPEVQVDLSEPSWFGRKTSMWEWGGTMEKSSPEFTKSFKPEV